MPPIGFAPIWVEPTRNLSQLLLPALIIGARLAAVSMRMTRSSLLEVLRHDYIRTAWAKGLRARVVIVKHAFKNAFIPVITIIGQQFSVLLGGTVIVEFIFLQPGVGSLMLDAVVLRDYTLIQGAVLFFAAVTVVMNLLVDLSYAWLDPRIRSRYRCTAPVAGCHTGTARRPTAGGRRHTARTVPAHPSEAPGGGGGNGALCADHGGAPSAGAGAI
jgi:peptide/nickel transport system permease protein